MWHRKLDFVQIQKQAFSYIHYHPRLEEFLLNHAISLQQTDKNLSLLLCCSYIKLVTTLRPASPGFATWHIGGFGDFGNFLAIFLAHFDPWTICDNSLQKHFLISPAV